MKGVDIVREIKFRGRQKDNGEWVYGYLLVTQMSGVYILGTTTQAKQGSSVFGIGEVLWQHEVDPATVGQFTGLHDKDGWEICGGDKCDTHTRWGKGVVTFERGMFKICGISLCTFTPSIEVIGNIHDKEA